MDFPLGYAATGKEGADSGPWGNPSGATVAQNRVLHRRKSAWSHRRDGPASIVVDAGTQLSETIGCAAERKAAFDAIRSNLDWHDDRAADEVADRMSENDARDLHGALM